MLVSLEVEVNIIPYTFTRNNEKIVLNEVFLASKSSNWHINCDKKRIISQPQVAWNQKPDLFLNMYNEKEGASVCMLAFS